MESNFDVNSVPGSTASEGSPRPALEREPVRGPEAARRCGSEPLLVSDREAAALLGISRAHFHRLRAAGKFGPEALKLGRCRRWDRDAIVRWVRAGCPDAATWRAMEAQRRRLRAV
jgi:predicted DNA-binding transcriptional regulator AlpA